MKQSFNHTTIKVFAVLVIVLSVLAIVLYSVLPTATAVAEETCAADTQGSIDTSAIDAWGGNYSDGTIRMIGAWYYSTLDDGSLLIEDETGELWNIDTIIDEQDFLLLWIADNNTQDNVHDDIVLKVWVEAYN